MRSLSQHIRRIAESAAGRMITFLGTGVSKPIVDRSGKSNRKNTSTLLTYKDKNYQFDVPPDLDPKVLFDFLFITHTHPDAMGGLPSVSDRNFTFGIPEPLVKKITEKGSWKKEELRIDRNNELGDLEITPFDVVHDIIYKEKTFGYRVLFKDGTVLVYATDILKIPEKSEQYFENVDLLIIDGAGWNASLATHFGMWQFLDLVKEKKWDIKKIYFTHVGRPVPDHEEAETELHNRYDGMDVKIAYDGLRISI